MCLCITNVYGDFRFMISHFWAIALEQEEEFLMSAEGIKLHLGFEGVIASFALCLKVIESKCTVMHLMSSR